MFGALFLLRGSVGTEIIDITTFKTLTRFVDIDIEIVGARFSDEIIARGIVAFI